MPMISFLQANLLGRDIQLHLLKFENLHLRGRVRATVTVTDMATGESITTTAREPTVNLYLYIIAMNMYMMMIAI